ncbi:MAG: hypothetical protein JNN08_15940 [Bryobacterales bacterium]|nr:hypothetical protein [Bryobacterales bacterium]
MVAQERPQVEHHARQSDGRWLLSDVRALEDSVRLTAVAAELRMADIYQGVAFD